ncbi:MAG: hypothetical protein M3O36_03425 [Myxococcota bacterium]|nr:hypothetical protein [Myxococcota bacterium]
MRASCVKYIILFGGVVSAVGCGSSTTTTASPADSGILEAAVRSDARVLLVGDSGAVALNPVGGPCADDPNCLNGTGSCQMADTNNLTGGYCAPNCRPGRSNCPPGATCSNINGDNTAICLKTCAADSDCRVAEGYHCIDIGPALALVGPSMVCWPSAAGSFNCNFDADCPPSLPHCTGGTGLAADPGDAGGVDDAGRLIRPPNFAQPGNGTCG